MSLVFAARDKTLGRKVAIKLLNEDYSRDAKRIEDFEKEAKITALISHPNVVRVYTVGQAYKRYYIAMELVEGDSLEQLMQKEGKLCEEMITRLAIEIVEGLKAAHAEGLLHRDMKPGNVLIDGKGHAKIVDFGLALMTSGGKAKADEIWATPYYVPPETLEMLEEDLRSDIYALGASLYHALSGKAPFTTETRSTTELLKIKTDVPRLGKAASDVSPFLCEVIDKAMAFDAADRFQSYDEFLAAFRQVEMYFRSGHEPEELSEPPKAQNVQRQAKNLKVLIAAAVAVIALIVGFAVIYSNKDPEEEPTPVVAYLDPSEDSEIDEEAMRMLIAAELRNAQTFLTQGKYMSAHERYLKLAKNKTIASETMYWTGMRSAISAWLGGESQKARDALREILKLQARSGVEELSTVDEKLQKAMVLLLGLKSIQLEQVSEISDDLDIMILFASALKEWDQGKWQNAEVLFLTLKRAKTDSGQTELNYYKEMSAAYLADLKLLNPLRMGFAPKTLDQAKQDLVVVLSARNDLKTKGRAPFNTLQWQRQINARIKSIEAKQRRDAKAFKEQAENADRLWKLSKGETLAALKQHDFERVVKELQEVKPTSEEEENWRSNILYLTENAMALYKSTFDALEGVSADFEVKRLDGMVEYEHLLGAKPEGLLVKVGEREKLLVWRELSPHTMIDLHKKISITRLTEDEVNQRREQLVSYTWLTGLESQAITAAASLAETSPVFAKRWKACMEAVN
jgi:serine/threonine protein kinase